jgi:hypothetical protein
MAAVTAVDLQIIAADAPIVLVIAEWGLYPLTPCCQASAKGSGSAVVCRGCYQEIDTLFGMSWLPGEDEGWSCYHILLQGVGVDEYKADEIVAHAREKAEAL